MKIATKDEMLKKATECMRELDIYSPYINGLKTKGPCFYEGFAGFWAYQEKELAKKVKDIEEKLGCFVYAITHEFTEFGEFYSMLYVSKYKEDWEYTLNKRGKMFIANAYVWNISNEYLSESGDIGIVSNYGGIKRVF